MKKVYALFFAAFSGLAMGAQVNVTFNVDMTGLSVDPTGVHIAGNFQDPNYDGNLENPSLVNWSPSATEMTDVNADNVYSVTLQLMPARYEFKFLNGNDWPMNESVPAACQVGNGNSNREIQIGTSDVTYTVCYQSCAPCGEKTVRFRVDLSQNPDGVNPVGVHVAGDFQGWDPATTILSDPDGNDVWEGYFNVGSASSVEYKFVNGDSWLFAESVPSDCGVGPNLNRMFTLVDDNTILDAVCFAGCSSCLQPTMVTFRVNMALQTVSANGVHVAGSFQLPNAWTPGDANYELTDPDADGIYELTVGVQPGSYAFKFVNGNAWGTDESVPAACNVGGNRELIVATDAVTEEYCYGQCTTNCISDPDPADITFRVNMSTSTVAPEGVFMIGGFTTPQWQAGAVQMTDDNADGIYEATVNISGPGDIQYKFVNGDVQVQSNEENTGIVDCGISNGIGGYNRTHTRSGVAEVLAVNCFNLCADCVVLVEELGLVSNMKVFPNPTQDFFNVTFNNTTRQNMTIRMINAVGQIAKTQYLGEIPVGQNTYRVDVNNLASGIYAFEISNGSQRQIVQIAVR